MLGKLTWNDLLEFLLKLKTEGKLEEENDVMLYNIETDDEYPCDLLEVDGRLVMAINWKTLD